MSTINSESSRMADGNTMHVGIESTVERICGMNEAL